MWFMRQFLRFGTVLVVAAGCSHNGTAPAETKTNAAQSAPSPQSRIERGRYVVTVGGCNDCHTPKKMGPNGPEPDMTRELSGNPATDKLAPVPAGLIAPDKYLTVVNNHLGAWVGPWGVSFAMNLTPDKATGLGSWTEEMFVTATCGRHKYPPWGVGGGQDGSRNEVRFTHAGLVPDIECYDDCSNAWSSRRVLSRSAPSFSRMWAAGLSPSRMSPRRRCSVPT